MTDAPPRWPPAERVHRVHDRYLLEVVEGLGLCPFARRSREQGRVERPLLWVADEPHDGAAVAARIASVCARNPDVEIILLTFLVPDEHPWSEPRGFESLLPELRERHETQHADGVPRFYMVPFHPRLAIPEGIPVTPSSLVTLIRRTPDPVIQCVRAELLDDVRRQAQKASEARFREAMAKLGPEILALVKHSVQTDPELSSDIARHNFDTAGEGDGHTALIGLLDDIIAERDRAYRPRAE